MLNTARNASIKLKKRWLNGSYYGVVFVIALGVFFADVLIKYIIRCHFYIYQSLPVIKNIFHLTFVVNKGAAFGLFPTKGYFLVFWSILLIIIFFVAFKSAAKKSILARISLGLILGGALSNLADRVFLGYVVDYLDFRMWPVFNLSDAAITTGTLLFIVQAFKKRNG